jgi:hypothetical protein
MRLSENAPLLFDKLTALSKAEGLRLSAFGGLPLSPALLNSRYARRRSRFDRQVIAAYFYVRHIPRDFVPQQWRWDGHFPSAPRESAFREPQPKTLQVR